MRTRSQRAKDWRLFGIAAFLTVFSFIVIFTGCATARGVSEYDGVLQLPRSDADSVTLVLVTIQNNRGRDLTSPRFYLDGMGRHDLGIVGSYSTVTKLVDTSWFGPDGCMKIVAHYVGAGDWTSSQFCWRRGEVIDVWLQQIFTTSSAWSHR